MPDVNTNTPSLDNLSPAELESRLQQIRSIALAAAKLKGVPQIDAFRELSTEQLHEIAVIAAKLRNLKASGPGKTVKRRDLSTPRSMDELKLLLAAAAARPKVNGS